MPSTMKKNFKRSSRHIEPNPSLHIVLHEIKITDDVTTLIQKRKSLEEDNLGFDYNDVAEDLGYEQFQAIYYNMSPLPCLIPVTRLPSYVKEKKSVAAILPEEYLVKNL